MGLGQRLRLFLIPLAVCGAVAFLAKRASDPVEALIRSNESRWQDEEVALLQIAKLSRQYEPDRLWRKCPVGEYDPNAQEALRRLSLRDSSRFIRLAATEDPVRRAAILLTLAETRPEGSKAVVAQAAAKDPDPWIRRTLAAKKWD